MKNNMHKPKMSYQEEQAMREERRQEKVVRRMRKQMRQTKGQAGIDELTEAA